MTAFRDDLLRGAVEAACDARDSGDRCAFLLAVRNVISVYRRAPLVEHAAQLEVAAGAEPVIEAAVKARTAELVAALVAARREAVLASAELAVWQVAA